MHIPPLEKENHRLKHAVFVGIWNSSQEGTHFGGGSNLMLEWMAMLEGFLLYECSVWVDPCLRIPKQKINEL